MSDIAGFLGQTNLNMIVLLQFALIETILTSICDIFPQLRQRKTFVIAGVCIVMYLMGLSMCSSGGLYVLNLLDSFGAGWNVLLIAVLEAICIIWVYGMLQCAVSQRKL